MCRTLTTAPARYSRARSITQRALSSPSAAARKIASVLGGWPASPSDNFVARHGEDAPDSPTRWPAMKIAFPHSRSCRKCTVRHEDRGSCDRDDLRLRTLREASRHPPGPLRRLLCLMSTEPHCASRGQRPKALPQSAQYERHYRHKAAGLRARRLRPRSRPSRKLQISGQTVYAGGCSVDNALASNADSANLPFGPLQHEMYKIMQGRGRTGRRLMKALDQISTKVYERGFDGSRANVHANRDGLDQKDVGPFWLTIVVHYTHSMPS